MRCSWTRISALAAAYHYAFEVTYPSEGGNSPSPEVRGCGDGHLSDADADGAKGISNVHYATGIYAYNISTTRWLVLL